MKRMKSRLRSSKVIVFKLRQVIDEAGPFPNPLTTFTDFHRPCLDHSEAHQRLSRPLPPWVLLCRGAASNAATWNGLQLLYKNSWQFTDESMRLPEFVHGFAPQMFTIVYCVLRCVSTLFHWWHFVVRPLPMSIATSSDAQKAGIQDRALLDTSWNKARTVEIATWCEQLQLWTCFE